MTDARAAEQEVEAAMGELVSCGAVADTVTGDVERATNNAEIDAAKNTIRAALQRRAEEVATLKKRLEIVERAVDRRDELARNSRKDYDTLTAQHEVAQREIARLTQLIEPSYRCEVCQLDFTSVALIRKTITCPECEGQAVLLATPPAPEGET